MNKKLQQILSVLYYVLLTATATDDTQKNEKCTNPYGTNGTCVPLNECPEIFDAATSKNGINVLFATKSYCGSDEEVLVCCEHPGATESANLDINSLLGICECGIHKEEIRIYGGIQAEIGEFPWIAGISYESVNDKTDVGIRCSGSLINDEYVLTAAHCLESSKYAPIFVILGELDTSTDPDCVEFVANQFCADPIKIIGIKEIIAHPFYNSHTQYNDIGLIRLEDKVIFTDFIAPICLPHPNLSFPEANERLTIAGWGRTETEEFSNVLLKVVVPIVSDDECRKQQMSIHTIHRHAFCAGGESGKGDCVGDTGGPLMKSHGNDSDGIVWYIHGIPSYGALPCGKHGLPTIYVNVSRYIGWILKTTIKFSKIGL